MYHRASKWQKKKTVVTLSVPVWRVCVLVRRSEVEVFLAPVGGFLSAAAAHQPVNSLGVENTKYTQKHEPLVTQQTQCMATRRDTATSCIGWRFFTFYVIIIIMWLKRCRTVDPGLIKYVYAVTAFCFAEDSKIFQVHLGPQLKSSP